MTNLTNLSLYTIKSYKDARSISLNHVERMIKNVSRLYTRRVFEAASLSASIMALRAQQMDEDSTLISKPSEWSMDDALARQNQSGGTLYSPGKNSIQRAWASMCRIVHLTLLASPFTILLPMAYLTGPNSLSTDMAWDYALWSIEKAGPTFVKLVQWATTRKDIFPHEFVMRCSILQDDTRGHTWAETKKILEQSLGPGYDDMLEFDDLHFTDNPQKKNKKRCHFDINQQKHIPIGSGCIAQVYKAKLKHSTSHPPLPSGTDVAIKVTHPNIGQKVALDFYILNKITALLENIPKLNLHYLSMQDAVRQFRNVMIPQLDLRIEAVNLRRFRRDFADDDRVSFPLPVDELTSKNVLVESFVHGDPILDLVEVDDHGRAQNMRARQELAVVGLETVMKMIFLYDFVHGDLHPGNILVDHNTATDQLRLNFIDCGLVVEMGESDHVNLVKILGSLIKRDGHLAGKFMVDTAKKCQASALDVELFCKGIETICKDDLQEHFMQKMGDYLAEICCLACKHKVKLEPSFLTTALACEIVEGIATSLSPAMEVQNIVLPMVVKAEVMHGLREAIEKVKVF